VPENEEVNRPSPATAGADFLKPKEEIEASLGSRLIQIGPSGHL